MSIAPSTAHPTGHASILIVAPAWVGDMVMAHALVQLLLRRNPELSIHMLAPAATEPLARRMPGVAATRVLNVGHGQLGLAARRALARALRPQRFQQALVLPNTFKSALLPWWARIPLRTGWHGEARFGLLNDRRRLDAARYPLMIERFMALGLPAGAPLPRPYPAPRLSVDADNRQRLLELLGLRRDGGVLALCPGAEFGPAKRWPSAHYAAVARHALAVGRQVWLLGSPGDAAACAEIRALAPGAVDLAGRTSLLDAVDLLSVADHVICNDSGLMHVAGAVGARVTAVFGSTSPAFTPPLGDGARVVRLALPCSPCFQRQCPLGHLRCLHDLAPEQVIEAL
ncbi:MAG: lipopolysaccharide heptosyltransferase II [Pseudomonadales bacterium]